MIQISSTEERPDNRFVVRFAGGGSMTVPRGVFRRLSVTEGDEVEDSEWEERLEEAWEETARSYTGHLISGRVRLSGEIRQKMEERGYPERIIEEEIARLEEAGLLDDARFVPKLVERELEKGYGPRRIQQKLSYKRGADRGQVEAALSELDEELDQAFQRALRKKCDKQKFRELEGEEFYKYREKVIARLARRGFSYSRIKRGLRELEN